MKKKIQKKKKMTLDKLAGMVQRGFVDIEERLGGRIDGVEQKLSSRIDGVEQKLGGRIDGVEMRLCGVETRLDDVVLDISDLKKGQKEILKKLDEKVDKVEFVKLEKRVDVLEKVPAKQKRFDR